MTIIQITKCDGTGCKRQIDWSKSNGLEPKYHKLSIGGSDFEMSFDHQNMEYEFCSIECLRNFLNEYYPAT